jgi:hypothetical protein
MLAFSEVLPAARPENPGREKQNRAEDQVCNITQFSVTPKPTRIEAVFLLYGWLAQCESAPAPTAAAWRLAISSRQSRIAHHLKKGNFHDKRTCRS